MEKPNLPVSYVGITPLYDFICDVDDLRLDDNLHLRRYDPLVVKPFLLSNDSFLRSLSAIVPNYLLWHEPRLSLQTVAGLLDYVELSGGHFSLLPLIRSSPPTSLNLRFSSSGS